MDITLLITLIGITQGLFILILLVLNAKKNKTLKYTIGLIIVFIIDLTAFYFIKSGLTKEVIFLSGIGGVTLFLYGPILYLYVSAVLGLESAKRWMNALHFIPAVLVFILTSPIFFAEYTYSKLYVWRQQFPPIIGNYSLGNLLFDHVIWYLFSLIYFLLCLKLMRSFRKTNSVDISVLNRRIRKLHLRWVEYLIIGYLTFPAIGLFVLFYNLFSQSNADSFSILNFFMVFHIFSITYIGFTNQELLTNPLGMFKYKHSKMDSAIQKNHIEKLKLYFEQEKPYLNQELTLKMVAADLDLNQHRISQVINEHFGHGFNDFVNSYRVDLAKKYILSPDKSIYTIEAIASEVGFKSKPTFNTAFKKKEGITPSEYKKLNFK